MRFRVIGVVLAAIVCSSTVYGQAATKEEVSQVNTLLNQISDELESLASENKTLRDEVKSLRADITKLQTGRPEKDEDEKDGLDATAPPGLIAAFALDMPKGVAPDGLLDDPCPDGWTRFREANGRFLLGVGKGPLTERAMPNETDGVQKHTLTPDEMPHHNHSGKTSIELPSENGSGFWWDKPGPSHIATEGSRGISMDHDTEHHHQIAFDGGGEPHNNMPPYIALYFCKKEG